MASIDNGTHLEVAFLVRVTTGDVGAVHTALNNSPSLDPFDFRQRCIHFGTKGDTRCGALRCADNSTMHD